MTTALTRFAAMAAIGVLAGALVAVSTGPATADRPSRGCDKDSYQATVYPLGWLPGDPINPDGLNTLHPVLLDALVTEFGSIQAGLDALIGPGATLDDLSAREIADYQRVDTNMDGVVCWKTVPDTKGHPSYVFNVTDNTSNH
jgi:hypothetical protein